MSTPSRSEGRNVHIYDEKDPPTVLGGLVLVSNVTNANFYSMIEVFIFFDQPYHLRDEGGITIPRDIQQLRPGSYYIVTNGTVTVSDEAPLVRTPSVDTGTHHKSFRDAVRERDGRCLITGQPAPRAVIGIWWGLEAAHIFPVAYREHWNQHEYGRWITIPPATESDGSYNSVQNGILLRNDIHMLFDLYIISINPDDHHKIVRFGPEGNITATHLDQQFLNDPRRPVDQLLRWHFRQAVLTNMKGAGEPAFEIDFPPGSDVMGEIMNGPKAAERMEFELFGCLSAVHPQ